MDAYKNDGTLSGYIDSGVNSRLIKSPIAGRRLNVRLGGETLEGLNFLWASCFFTMVNETPDSVIPVGEL